MEKIRLKWEHARAHRLSAHSRHTAAMVEGDTMALDMDKYGYVIDKGPICAITKAPEGAAEMDINLFSYRAFGLPISHAVHADIPGHYVVDMQTLVDQPSAQILELPGIITFKDPGTPAMFGLNFKAASNGKLYVNCIPTALKHKPDPDKDYKHIGDKDIRLFNISLITSISHIADQNGQPFRKNFNLWLREGHSAMMKRSKVKNLLEIKMKLRPTSFTKNVSDAVHEWAEDFRKETTADCGENDSNSAAAHSTAEIQATNKTLLDKHAELVKKVKADLHHHVQALAVSVGFRIIEVELSEPVTDEHIARWLDSAVAPIHADKLMEAFKSSGILAQLKALDTESQPLPICSPLKAVKVTDARAEEPEMENSEESEADIPAVEMVLRKRKEPSEAPASATSASAATPSTSGGSNCFSSASTSGSEKNPRKYVKSGKYSKNPLLRAQQITAVASGKGQKGRDPPASTTNAKESKGVCLCVLVCVHLASSSLFLPHFTPTTQIQICRWNCRASRGYCREGKDDQVPAEAAGRQEQRD